jgi:hypothetical protein
MMKAGRVAMTRPCRCSTRRFVRSLEEDDAGLPSNARQMASTREASLWSCWQSGAWWERLPHEVYGYAWYQTEQRYWDAVDQEAAVAAWRSNRQEQGL